ncbi:MAG: MucR family transcriptional regulator [Alphaproteobacteria bacterium]
MSDEISREELLVLTTEVVSSYVSHNTLPVTEIPDMISQVYKSLSSVGSDNITVGDRPQPAVPIKKSITDDYLICLEDGKKLKMLKRHLKTAYNMTPEAYRERWGLPADYPMVAPSYAEKRSKLAKDIGLGTRG